MMKLKHLFHNRDLAHMLVKNWEHDESSLEMFEHCRISANAIYPFKKNNALYFLRFAPSSEKVKENILAELDFINYLRNNHYNALEPVPSKSGEELLCKSTPWGEYYASVFKRVNGQPISESGLGNNVLLTLGKSLGRLHKLSGEYLNPKTKRWTHNNVFDWIDKTLMDLSGKEMALNESTMLREYFSTLPINRESYGLIHYDFELDNVFYDNVEKTCSVIDFDDAMYHWYIMDIEQTLDSLKDEIPENEHQEKRTVLIQGYRSEFDVSNEMLEAMPVFRRFANLYGYARISRSIQETWDNEPEWLIGLRLKLNKALDNRAVNFGKKIEYGI